MRFLSDDGQFGFLVTRLTGPRMYRFQVIIDGQLIGDSEPCIPGSAMKRLVILRDMTDSRLGHASRDSDSAWSLVRADELHDATSLVLTESLDGWSLHGYTYSGTAVIMAQKYGEGSDAALTPLIGPILVSVVTLDEFNSIVDATRSYWAKTNDITTLPVL